ncbi:hypothetical protein UFOVP820_59 [uncultured Caudovirales phage]|uniref:Uncharacterized protein n=1 Tax=uncultured Caudovirales phage TaxID=2100421 RepID=A0A6J5P2J9_9CAUD|nr:hypothetical protein UFOVP820_59 [uncultured Caudovirales phage]
MGWANKLLGWTDSVGAEVNSEGALYTVNIDSSGTHYTVATKTATIAAAAAAGATVFAMRLDPGAGAKRAWIDSMTLRWTTITAFTTAITAGRSLVITRGTGAAASGGTAIASATKKDSSYASSEFDSSLGGDMRVASTGALTVTGITFESVNLAEMTLTHVGAAGAYYETIYEISVRNHPVELVAGEVLAVRVGASTMDAAGTWQLGVEVNWRESDVEG